MLQDGRKVAHTIDPLGKVKHVLPKGPWDSFGGG